jgi:hypothetical protein
MTLVIVIRIAVRVGDRTSRLSITRSATQAAPTTGAAQE